MTCVVGLVDNGHIYIGADSYCRTRWDGGHIMAEPKVFHRGPFIIGGCGRTRDSQLSEPYLATGSGWAFASGALHSMASLPPKERITKALEAAAHYNCYVRPPFTILSDTDDT